MRSGLLLAIDGGQSSVRARMVSPSGIELERQLPPLLTDEPLMPQLAAAIHAVLSPHPRGGVRVAAALSGLTLGNADAAGVLATCSGLGVESLRLVHDSVSGYLGCLGDRAGAALAAGTGVVALATGPSGCSRVDGWGNIMGDAGSGYWLGRAALEAAMRAYDGRGPATGLLDLLREDFQDIEAAYIEIQSSPEKVALVASYARKVIDLSERDAVAASLVDRATDELALSVDAALRNTGWAADSSPAVSWVGKILSNPLVSEPLWRKLSGWWPDAELLPPKGGPLDGVTLLDGLQPEHTLYPLLHIA